MTDLPDSPSLYREYSSIDLFSLFGGLENAEIVCDGQWQMFEEAIVCVTDIGASHRHSHFIASNQFVWVADKPYKVSIGFTPAIPKLIVGSAGKDRSIHLFARRLGDKDFLYLGLLNPSYVQSSASGDHFGTARLELKQALPSVVWSKLGGYRPGDMDHDTVDQAIARLLDNTTVDDRLLVLRKLVQYFHGEIGANDGLPDAALDDLPYPLRWWFNWAGTRENIMSGQNFLLSPLDTPAKRSEIRVEDGLLLFYVENQAVYRWATERTGEDPPVFGRYQKTDPWQPEGIRLSEHLISACLFEAIGAAPYGACEGCVDDDTFSEIERIIPPISIPAWKWLGGCRFYAKGGAFMYAAGNGTHGHSVWIGAKSEHPLQFLKPLIHGEWDYMAI